MFRTKIYPWCASVTGKSGLSLICCDIYKKNVNYLVALQTLSVHTIVSPWFPKTCKFLTT